MLSGVLQRWNTFFFSERSQKKVFVLHHRESKYILKFTLTVGEKRGNQKINLYGLSVGITCSTTL